MSIWPQRASAATKAVGSAGRLARRAAAGEPGTNPVRGAFVGVDAFVGLMCSCRFEPRSGRGNGIQAEEDVTKALVLANMDKLMREQADLESIRTVRRRPAENEVPEGEGYLARDHCATRRCAEGGEPSAGCPALARGPAHGLITHRECRSDEVHP